MKKLLFILLIVSLGFCVSSTDWVEQDLSLVHSRHAIMLVNISQENPLSVIDPVAPGGIRQVYGELFYIRVGYASNISCEGVQVPHAYYNFSGHVFYCAEQGGYKEVQEANVLFTELAAGNPVTFNWDVLLPFARDADSYVEDLKTNYITYLKSGAYKLGLDADWSFLNETKLLNELKGVRVVFTNDIPRQAAADPQTKTMLYKPLPVMVFEDNRATTTHEFTHVILANAYHISTGSYGSPFDYPLHEGETDFFTGVVHLGKDNEFISQGYDGRYVVATYAYLLGGDKFFRVTLTPGQANLHEEMDALLGEGGKHLKMTAYFESGNMKYFNDNQQPYFSKELRLLGELEKAGVDWKSAIDKVEPLFQPRVRNITFYERFGINESKPLLEQAESGTQWYSWGIPTTPFDLQEELNNPPQRLIPVLEAVPLLNSLDYKTYDIPTQHVAFGLWRSMIESYVSYWNGLSSSERTDPQNMADLLWFYQANFALASRFGMSPIAVETKIINAYGRDEPLNIQETDHCNLINCVPFPLANWILDPPYAGPLSQPIQNGDAVLVPSEIPWIVNQKEYRVGNGKTWLESASVNGNVTLHFQSGWAQIEGMDVTENGPDWINVQDCQVITQPGNYYLTNNLYGNLSNGACIQIAGVSGVTLGCNSFEINENEPYTGNTGIFITDSTDVHIKNCELTNYAKSIGVRSSSYVSIENSGVSKGTAAGFSDGIYVLRSRDVLLQNNQIDGGGYCNFGIELTSSNRTTLLDNEEKNCSEGLYMSYANDSNISNNYFGFNKGYAGIRLISSSNNRFNKNNVSNNAQYGFALRTQSNFNNLSNSITDNNGIDGISIEDSIGNNIDPPRSCYNTQNGVTLDRAAGTTINGLIACNNGNAGIEVTNSTKVVIGNSILSQNLYGILFDTFDTQGSASLNDNTFASNRMFDTYVLEMQSCGNIVAKVTVNDATANTKSGQKPLQGAKVLLYNKSDPCFLRYAPPNKAENIAAILKNCVPVGSCVTNSSGECPINGLYAPRLYKGIVNSTAYPGKNPKQDINLTTCNSVYVSFAFLSEPKGKTKGGLEEVISGNSALMLLLIALLAVAAIVAILRFKDRKSK